MLSLAPVASNTEKMFTVKPDHGILEANSGTTLEVTCIADYIGSCASKVVLSTEHDGPQALIYLKAEVLSPTVSLSISTFDLGASYLGVPVRRQFTVKNSTIFKVDYNWTSIDTRGSKFIFSN
jgi:hypothetical protein